MSKAFVRSATDPIFVRLTINSLNLFDLLVGAGALGVERGVALLGHGAAAHGVAAEAGAALAARLAAAAAPTHTITLYNSINDEKNTYIYSPN